MHRNESSEKVSGPDLSVVTLKSLRQTVTAFSDHFKLPETESDVAAILKITQSARLGFKEEYSAECVITTLRDLMFRVAPAPLLDTERHAKLPTHHHNVKCRLLKCLLRCNVKKLEECDKILSGLAHEGFTETDLFAALCSKYQHVNDPYLREQFHMALVHDELLTWIRHRIGTDQAPLGWGHVHDFMDGLRDGVVLCQLLQAKYPEHYEARKIRSPVREVGGNVFSARDKVEQFLRFCSEELGATAGQLFDIDEVVMATNDVRVVTTLLWLAGSELPMLDHVVSMEECHQIHTLVHLTMISLPAESQLSMVPSTDMSCDFMVTHPHTAPGVLSVPVRILQHYLVVQYNGLWDELGYFLSRRLYEWEGVTWCYESKRLRDIFPSKADTSHTLSPPSSAPAATSDTWTLMTPQLSTGGSVSQPIDLQISSSLTVRMHNGAEGVIGCGAYGVVYRGLDLSTSALLAVKVVRTEGSTTAQQRLRREISVLQRLHHSNIVRYYGSHETANVVYIVTGYAAGGSLATVLKMFGVLPENIIAQYAEHMLRGLQFLHSYDVVHRDIKPGNILLQSDGRVALADFGCCKYIAEAALLGNSGVVGTPAYMAPEVITTELYSPACDIWALGCCLLEIATGQRAWQNLGLGPIPLLYHIGRSGETPHISTMLSDPFQSFLRRCFTWNHTARPKAEELLQHDFLRCSGGHKANP